MAPIVKKKSGAAASKGQRPPQLAKNAVKMATAAAAKRTAKEERVAAASASAAAAAAEVNAPAAPATSAEAEPWAADIEFVSSSEGEMSSDEEAETKTGDATTGATEEDGEEKTRAFMGTAEEIALTKKVKATAATKKSTATAPSTAAATAGVVYLGRIPHGFYEEQMRAYFSQFGELTRMRLSRNKRTGASKHYAFVEFKHAEVAEVVAETMDNYLLFGHILKCKVIPADKVHENLWVGANRKFRVIPFAKIHREKHNKPKTAEKKRVLLNRMIDREQRLRDKLADMGIEYEFPGYAGAAAKVCKTDAAVAVTEEKVKAKTSVTAKKTATKAATPAAKQEVAPPTPTQTATPATKKTATKKATPAKKEDAEPVATPVVMKRKQEDKTEKAPASTAAKKVKKDVVAPKKASAAKKTTRKATA